MRDASDYWVESMLPDGDRLLIRSGTSMSLGSLIEEDRT